MDLGEQIDRMERSLQLRSPVVDVEPFEIERITGDRAVIQARVHFFDGSYLAIRERIDTSACYCEYLTYAYQYVIDDEQIFRYDNRADHPEIKTFPEHKHIGPDSERNIVAGVKPSYRQLFKEISASWD